MLKRATLPTLLATVLLFPGCRDDRTPAGPILEKEGSLFTLGASPARVRIPTFDEHLAELAGKIPGFGGYFLDPDGKIAVHLVNPGQRARAVEVLTQVLSGRRFSARIPRPVVSELRVYQGKYDFLELSELYQRMTDVLNIPKVVFTDIDERRNRLLVAVEDAPTKARVEAALMAMNIPSEAVIIEFTGPTEFLSHDSLTSPLIPAEGGLRIYFLNANNQFIPCTLGFNARDYNSTMFEFFVTASHCSRVRGGGADGTDFYQETSPGVFRRIGSETRDPDYFDRTTNAECPSGRRCRYSDAALVVYARNSDSRFGFIAQTTYSSRLSAGSTLISDSKPRFTIVGEYYFPIVGEPLEKMGSVTGWTWGGVREGEQVGNSCVRLPAAADITYLCQAIVESFAQVGDSGAPVFSWVGGNDVNVIGTLVGRNSNDPTVHYYFSPMNGILNDLGNLFTYPFP